MVNFMNYINFAKEIPQANCLVTVGKTGYWCDSYIIMADGILMANKKPNNPELIILTRIDHTGLILTEFNGETTFEEFEELRAEMEEELEHYIQEGAGVCDCGDPNCIGDGDEESGNEVVNPNFKTIMTDQDVMSYA